MKETIKEIQRRVGVTADGIMGPVTLEAILERLEERGAGCPSTPDERTPSGYAEAAGLRKSGPWPTQREVRSGRSVFGEPGESELVSVVPPYELLYEGKPVRSIRVHRLVATCVKGALQDVLDHYGEARIRELRLNEYGGSYHYRGTRGGSTLSMHAWGIALDFMPDGNELETKAPRAVLSGAEYEAWWQIWESYGAVSLGRVCDRDWMHVQFARL